MVVNTQGLSFSATFALSRFGESLTRILAECWADKMSFLYALSIKAQEAGAFVGEADLSVWRETPALRALLADEEVPSDVQVAVGARAQEIRSLRSSWRRGWELRAGKGGARSRGRVWHWPR